MLGPQDMEASDNYLGSPVNCIHRKQRVSKAQHLRGKGSRVRDDYSTDLDQYSSKSEGVVVPKIKSRWYTALQGGFPAGVAGAIGAVALLLIAAGVMAYIVRRKRKRNQAKVEAQQMDTDENPIYGLYARNSEEELPTESTVTDENDYYGV